MKAKKYFDVFGDAANHPKSKRFAEDIRARIVLAEAINRERVSQSLSMKSLAEKADTTPAVISRIENAQVSTGIDLIYRIFKALGKNKVELSFATE
ncbi:MAG: helix-turn-helix transcriptional regulator [Desulfobacteraceae bacterium]|nr:helix-turn-helix transcriptional regulator [Desulfobacteraceae bacterium]